MGYCKNFFKKYTVELTLAICLLFNLASLAIFYYLHVSYNNEPNTAINMGQIVGLGYTLTYNDPWYWVMQIVCLVTSFLATTCFLYLNHERDNHKAEFKKLKFFSKLRLHFNILQILAVIMIAVALLVAEAMLPVMLLVIYAVCLIFYFDYYDACIAPKKKNK